MTFKTGCSWTGDRHVPAGLGSCEPVALTCKLRKWGELLLKKDRHLSPQDLVMVVYRIQNQGS